MLNQTKPNQTKRVLYFVLLMLLLVSCNPFQHPIVWKWKYDEQSRCLYEILSVEFLSDGTFIFAVGSGKYRIIDDTRVEITLGGFSRVASYKIENNALILNASWAGADLINCRYVRE